MGSRARSGGRLNVSTPRCVSVMCGSSGGCCCCASVGVLGDGGAECVTTLKHGEENMGNPILAGDAIVTWAMDNKVKIWRPAAAA